MRAYYNEFDPFAAAWLRELIADGLIAPGDVDDRSITDVSPADLVGYTQCHFFAGIGGWSLALRLAGWPDDRPVWTGSCPCQPFSTAGKGEGSADPRHLWPQWFRLVCESRPGVIFGEQVASAIGHGWLDIVCADLEGEGYAVGAVVLPAASVGAPHKRDRCWFVADADGGRSGQDSSQSELRADWAKQSSPDSGHPVAATSGKRPAGSGWWDIDPADVADANGRGRGGLREFMGQSGATRQGWPYPEKNGDIGDTGDDRHDPGATQPLVGRVAHGIPNRVGQLRGYGNAIVPQAAAAFVRAYLDSPVPLDDSPRGV